MLGASAPSAAAIVRPTPDAGIAYTVLGFYLLPMCPLD